MTKRREIRIRLIHPSCVLTYNKPHSDGIKPAVIPNPCCESKKVGDLDVAYVSAPGTGTITHVISRVDNHGVWGYLIEDTSRELTKWDVI